jgi:hypothetical protein
MTKMIRRRAALAAALSFPLAFAAGPAVAMPPPPPPQAMVRFDALYIPALSLTSAAQADAKAGPKAVAALLRLRQAWPALRADLLAQWPVPSARREWAAALVAVDRALAGGDTAGARADWAAAHEALEAVRPAMLQARQGAGIDYFVDRLTAFHEPMETLALAGAKLQPAQLTAAKRAELEGAFAEARALWRAIETHPADPAAHALSPARAAQLAKGLADETAALSRLSEALRGSDAAALLKAASAIKPPFARSFTAFGLAEGESLAP